MPAATRFGGDTDGATPLDDEQRKGLRPTWITTRGDLNEAEAQNIGDGRMDWQRRRPPLGRLLTEQAVQNLHKDLFGQVWTWAGTYRQRELSIGIDPRQVREQVRNLVADAAYWFAGPSQAVDEAAAGFHHRLVQIHPFPNGNGRHAREMTDLILISQDAPLFTWGGRDLDRRGSSRTRYIGALRAADNHDLQPLIAFVRT